MLRSTIFWTLLIILFACYPRWANADDSCLCNQTVTLEGAVFDIESTPEGNYNIETSLTCGKYGMNGVNIVGQGKPPASCKQLSHFTVSGTVSCKLVYIIVITPSELSCFSY
jgi:hypothetical protein